MRISVQRRLGLPLDVACQAAAAGKKTRNKKTHDEFGDAAVNVPQTRGPTRRRRRRGEILSKPDVTVTNQSDKDAQLPKLLKLNDFAKKMGAAA